ncbi:MORN-repeat protein [Faustovirus]|nr:MORN-repeat protein [Faustovirus]
MEDVICIHIAPLCGRTWRVCASLNKALHARLEAQLATATTAKQTVMYTSGAIIYTVIGNIKHGAFEVIDSSSRTQATGFYRLGQLHGTLNTLGDVLRTINYYNGRLHGKYIVTNGAIQHREINYRHGLIHGPQHWVCEYKAVGTRTDISEYVDGVIHGVEDVSVTIYGKVYTYFRRAYDMGKSHGNACVYEIDISNLNNIRHMLVFDVDYNNGKVKRINCASGGVIEYKWVRRFNRTYLERWRDNSLELSGDATAYGYMDGVVTSYIDTYNSKDTYELYNRVQSGWYIESVRGRGPITKMVNRRQYTHDGLNITFNEYGKMTLLKNVVDGYLHGLVKRYKYSPEMEYTGAEMCNYLFGFGVGLLVAKK